VIDVVGFLESLEKLAYKILLWVLLIPKTLWQIVAHPKWAPCYIQAQLSNPLKTEQAKVSLDTQKSNPVKRTFDVQKPKQEKVPFDEFVSPMILLFMVALAPALILILLPDHDIGISSFQTEGSTMARNMTFKAEAAFIPMSGSMRDQYTWHVELIATDGAGTLRYDENGDLVSQEIYRETYDEYADRTKITILGSQNEYIGEVHTQLTRDRNLSEDEFQYSFERDGNYFVYARVVRSDIKRNDVVLDEQETRVLVEVPIDDGQPISVRNYDQSGTTGEYGNLLTSETAIIVALFLMTPPLFFAWMIRLGSGNPISETLLKGSFYTQCYYFSPLCLAIWVTFYGFYFYTLDIFSFYNEYYQFALLLPVTLAFCWFINAETHAIEYERELSPWQSFVVVVVFIFALYLMVKLISNLWSSTPQDEIRKWLVGGSPPVFYLILPGMLVYRFFGWFIKGNKFLPSDLILLLSFLPATFFLFGGSLLALQSDPAVSTPAPVSTFVSLAVDYEVPTTPIPVYTAIPPANTSTPLPLPSADPVYSNLYYLKKGEFPYCIARRFNIQPGQLLSLNGFVSGQAIPEGTPLYLPEQADPFPGNRSLLDHPATIIVKSSNETVYSIACQFGDVDPDAIAQVNGIPVSASLVAGQQLTIP